MYIGTRHFRGFYVNVPEEILLTAPIRPSSIERLQLGGSTVASGGFVALDPFSLVELLGAMRFGLGIQTSASRGCAHGAMAFERCASPATRAAACEVVEAEDVADRRDTVSVLIAGPDVSSQSCDM
jgi:hypothetical protein